MKFFKSLPLKSLLVVLACLVVFFVSYSRSLSNYELFTYDLRFRLRPAQETSSDVVIVEISDDSLKNLGTWPLPRDFHASLIDVLKGAGARMIIFDILFSEPTLYDEALTRAIQKAGNVYLPVVFDLGQKTSGDRAVHESRRFLTDLIPSFREEASGIGSINVFVDADGKTRKIPLLIKEDQRVWPSMSFKAACDYLGLDSDRIDVRGDRLTVDRQLVLPISQNGTFLVNYPGPWNKAFRHYSYFEILKSFADVQNGLTPKLDLSLFENKVCFIGLTAAGTSDLRPIPLEKIYPMLGLQASIFDSIVRRQFITDAGPGVNTLVNLLIFLLSLLLCFKLNPLRSFLAHGFLVLVYFSAATLLFIRAGYWLDLFLPLGIVFATFIGFMTVRFFEETKKRQLLEKELDIARTIQQSFLPQDIQEFYGICVSSFIQPAKFVAGDLYDILLIDEKRIGVFIGDVSGKGVSASLIMAQTISLFRIFARQFSNCSEVLTFLNKELYGRFSGRFVTGLYLIIDTSRHHVRVGSAGHAPVLLYKKEQDCVIEIDLAQDIPLGVLEDVEYQEVGFDLGFGDKIVIFTDGLPEARNRKNEEFGLDRIKKIVRQQGSASCEHLAGVLKADVDRFSQNRLQHDDMTLIVLSL
ncbi:MAG: CHASE2 domain-containing protein [Candidatus Omnitrophota bacterium]